MPPGVKTQEERAALNEFATLASEMRRTGKLTDLSHEERQAELDRTIAKAQLIRIQAQKRLKGLST